MPNFVHTKVDPDQLKTTAGNISECLLRLENAFKAVGESLASLGATWKGPASENFFAQYALDKETFSSHMKWINTLNTQLREAAGIFDGADAKAHDLVNQLKI